MIATQSLLKETEHYAREVLSHQLPEGYTYHTLNHTEKVVEVSEIIAQSLNLSQADTELVKIAAWLHDLGFVNEYRRHEAESKKMARAFLQKQGASESLIQQVEGLIEATRLGQTPQNRMEEVIKDADLFNLSTPEALDNSELIRDEWRIFCQRDFSDEGWDEFNYDFFKNYRYYTPYALEHFDPIRKKHAKTLKKRIKNRQKKKNKKQLKKDFGENQALLLYELEQQEERMEKLKRKLRKAKEQQPDRGIETMFRTTYRTHINLSSIADNKANILLTVNALIISFIFTDLFIRNQGLLEENPGVLYPIFVILIVCMTTIVFAILATRPKVNEGVFTREDILQKKTNLLFFGNFHSMDVDEYIWGMSEMMKDANYLYGSMSKDIYFLGKVLAKKFRLLRIAYNVFMYGIGAAILTFALTLWLSGGNS